MSLNTAHTDVHSQQGVVNLADWRVRLRGSTSHGAQEVECAVRQITESGMIVETPSELGRFAWMDVNLPDGSGVRALGEVVPRRDAVELAMEVRFKHLFPDHKARLLSALALQA
ncbi:MAG: hypothetical protein KC502_04295 [Myxococcales bacterium]|nr:hypothetical protein [Myxococcales bacterium]